MQSFAQVHECCRLANPTTFGLAHPFPYPLLGVWGSGPFGLKTFEVRELLARPSLVPGLQHDFEVLEDTVGKAGACLGPPVVPFDRFFFSERVPLLK